MSVVWKLEYDGQVRPLAQWGLDNAKLSFGNQVYDTLTLTVAEGAEDVQFEFEKKVVLWRDNVRWFHGWITQLPFQESAAAMRQQYVASGPWYWLDKIIFQQPSWVLTDPNQPSLGYSVVNVGRLVLFQSASGEKSTAGEQAQEVVDYAIFKATQYNAGVALFSRGSFEEVEADAPWEKGLDLTCSEALRRCMRWTRDAVAYWDYSGEIPELNVKRRAGLAAAALSVTEGLRIAEYSVTPRPDLQPRGVLIRFQRTRSQVTDGKQTGAQWTEFVDQTAGTADGGPRCITATLPLSGSGEGAEPIPDGLAQDYFDSISTLQWEGMVRLLEAAPTGMVMVGKVLNFTGGRAAWETMAAVIQRVTIDLVAHETVAEFGPADQLGPQEFLDQVRFQNGDPAGGSATGRMDGTPENPQPPRENPPAPPSGPPGGPGGPPINNRKITLCGPDGQPEDFVISGFSPT